MKCKFCLNEKPLIRAHIIPEGFFRRLRDGEDPPRLVTSNEYPKRVPIGVYDSTILCADCERLFGDWDDHAQQIMSQLPIGEPLKSEDKTVAYKISGFNYNKLKLFFISLVWRASVSSHPFYRRINLGPYEDISKAMISNLTLGNDDDFATTIARFEEHPLSATILDPHPERFQGINYCRFYLSDYVAYIKIDKRPAPDPFNFCSFKNSEPLHIICRDLSKSKELPLIHEVGQAANNRRQRSAR